MSSAVAVTKLAIESALEGALNLDGARKIFSKLDRYQMKDNVVLDLAWSTIFHYLTDVDIFLSDPTYELVMREKLNNIVLRCSE
jgi:hypothetical protein